MLCNNAGEYLYGIGNNGSGDGKFLKPVGLVIDKLNSLMLCDAGSRKLQLFTLDGKCITRIAGSFFEDGDPRYAVISDTGHLFVSDSDWNCVLVFH